MLRSRFQFLALVACVASLPGCLALSFGGKSQQVDTVNSESPQTQERLAKLESRVDALEQQFALPPAPALGPPLKRLD